MAASAAAWRGRHGWSGSAGGSGAVTLRSFGTEPERDPPRDRLRGEAELLRDRLRRRGGAEAIEPQPERLRSHEGAPEVRLRRLDHDVARPLRQHRAAVRFGLALEPLDARHRYDPNRDSPLREDRRGI